MVFENGRDLENQVQSMRLSLLVRSITVFDHVKYVKFYLYAVHAKTFGFVIFWILIIEVSQTRTLFLFRNVCCPRFTFSGSASKIVSEWDETLHIIIPYMIPVHWLLCQVTGLLPLCGTRGEMRPQTHRTYPMSSERSTPTSSWLSCYGILSRGLCLQYTVGYLQHTLSRG